MTLPTDADLGDVEVHTIDQTRDDVPWDAFWPEPDPDVDSREFGESEDNDGAPGAVEGYLS